MKPEIELGHPVPLGTLFTVDPRTLSDEDLALYTQSIKAEYSSVLGDTVIRKRDGLDFLVLLTLATGEKNGRTASRLAEKSFWVSVVAVVVAFFALIAAA